MDKQLIERIQDLSGIINEEINNNFDMMRQESNKYNSSEELLRNGGFSTEALDKAAFGFTENDIKILRPEQLNVKYKVDMLNPIEKQRVSGLDKVSWARKVDLSTPIDVSYEKGKFYIEDGHHRYYAAKILGKDLNVNLTIKDNPVIKLSDKSYDDFTREFYNILKHR